MYLILDLLFIVLSFEPLKLTEVLGIHRQRTNGLPKIKFKSSLRN